MNKTKDTVKLSEDENRNNCDEQLQIASVTNPPHRYICHTTIQKLYIFECELQWRSDEDDDSSTNEERQSSNVEPKKARIPKMIQFVKKSTEEKDRTNNENVEKESNEQRPLYPGNKDIVCLLKRFSRAFLYGLLGIKEMFPENGTKGTRTQHRWYREILSEGILQLERCEVPNVLCINRDLKVFDMIPALENYWFSELVSNLIKHMHFAIAYDINTDANNPDGNYHVVVRHGKTNVRVRDTCYYVYGNEPEDPERKLIH